LTHAAADSPHWPVWSIVPGVVVAPKKSSGRFAHIKFTKKNKESIRKKETTRQKV